MCAEMIRFFSLRLRHQRTRITLHPHIWLGAAKSAWLQQVESASFCVMEYWELLVYDAI